VYKINKVLCNPSRTNLSLDKSQVTFLKKKKKKKKTKKRKEKDRPIAKQITKVTFYYGSAILTSKTRPGSGWRGDRL
jgi:hypothetical protein